MHDLAVIIVSIPNEARWLTPCLTTVFEHAGALSMDVVVVDNDSAEARELVDREFPEARVVSCKNRGFSHANNRALMTCDARYVLFLNPDTEIVEGTFENLVASFDERPELGLAGVRQLTPEGEVYPTIRRFPNALRALGEAFGSERLGGRASWLGERELRPGPYERETPCDWTTGSFMLARREAIEAAGFFDERFFLYAEERDLCYRIRRSGWEVVHLPQMTIVHHAGKGGVSSTAQAQMAYSKRLYARKHLSQPHRSAYVAALLIHFLLRSLLASGEKRAASRRVVRTLLGLEEPPYGEPPVTAVAPRRAT